MGALQLVLVLGQLAADGGLSPPPAAPVETARVASPVDAGVVEGAAAPERVVRVKLKDGQTLSGHLVLVRPDLALVLRLRSGAELTLPGDAVASVEDDAAAAQPEAEGWFKDANRTRYLFGPSAMMLKRNELSFSQTELVLSGLSWGVTDWFSVQVASVVPAWFIPPIPNGFNLLLAAKVGGPITEAFHLAAGVQGLWLPAASLGGSGVPLVGVGFLTATLGSADLHGSLSLGLPFSGFSGLISGSPIITVSATWRVLQNLALVTEHWFILNLTQVPDFTGGGTRTSVAATVGNGLAARIMGERLAVDLGFLVLSSNGYVVPFPVPWVTFTYNFTF